jgi:hypothetical protein
MRRAACLLALLALLVLPGCYHATVNTGMTPGTQTIHQPWANSFVFGLVPPPTVEAMEQCPSGVARVETQHSFLNGLVAFLTFSIYTPMDILVTCAAGGMEDDAAAQDAVRDAESFKEALGSGEPFLVDLR